MTGHHTERFTDLGYKSNTDGMKFNSTENKVMTWRASNKNFCYKWEVLRLEIVKENKSRIWAEQGINMNNQCWGVFKEGKCDQGVLLCDLFPVAAAGLHCHHCLFHFSMYSCDCICPEQGFQQEHLQWGIGTAGKLCIGKGSVYI